MRRSLPPLQLCIQQTKYVDGSVHVLITPLAVVVDAFHVEEEAAICASLTFLAFVVWSLGALSAAVALDCGRMFPYVDETSSPAGRSVERERLYQRSLHALDKYRRLLLVSTSDSALTAVSYDQGLVVPYPSTDCSVRCIRKRTLFHSIDDFWNTMLSMMKKVHEAKPRLKKKSRNFDPSTLSS